MCSYKKGKGKKGKVKTKEKKEKISESQMLAISDNLMNKRRIFVCIGK